MRIASKMVLAAVLLTSLSVAATAQIIPDLRDADPSPSPAPTYNCGDCNPEVGPQPDAPDTPSGGEGGGGGGASDSLPW